MIHGCTKQKATGPTSRIELFVSAKNLTDLDTFTLSDPVCTLKVKNSKLGGYISYGETEVIDNNLNPKWVEHFQVEYYFDKQQYLLFEVWDDDEENRELIGSCETTLSEIMVAP